MSRVPNVGILLLWPGVSLIAYDHFGFTAAGMALVVGWFVGAVASVIDDG